MVKRKGKVDADAWRVADLGDPAFYPLLSPLRVREGNATVAYFERSGTREGDLANARRMGAARELEDALTLYVKLDNDRRAGCRVDDADWAEAHQAALAALAKARDRSPAPKEALRTAPRVPRERTRRT